MVAGMFPRVKFERKIVPKKFVAANGELVRNMGDKTILLMTNEGIQRCITLRSAGGCQASHLTAEGAG